MVRGWFGGGSGVVRRWFGGGSGWFGGGSGVVRGWFGGGSVMAAEQAAAVFCGSSCVGSVLM